MQRLVLIIAYIIGGLWILSLVLPASYCLQHHCSGPDYDGFMPAFAIAPIGGLAALIALPHAIQGTKKQTWSWVFWLFAVVFAINLASVALFVVIAVFKNFSGH